MRDNTSYGTTFLTLNLKQISFLEDSLFFMIIICRKAGAAWLNYIRNRAIENHIFDSFIGF